jgi:hypothetical protein
MVNDSGIVTATGQILNTKLPIIEDSSPCTEEKVEISRFLPVLKCKY